jgi:hypothetical protein
MLNGPYVISVVCAPGWGPIVDVVVDCPGPVVVVVS